MIETSECDGAQRARGCGSLRNKSRASVRTVVTQTAGRPSTIARWSVIATMFLATSTFAQSDRVKAKKKKDPAASRTNVPTFDREPPIGIRDRDSRPHRPRGLWARMNEEERAELLTFVEEHFPRLYLELERLEERQPARHVQRMTRIASQMRHLHEVMETQPERGALMIKERRLDMEIAHLATQYRNSRTDRRPRIRRQIRALCEESFDVRHERRELEIRKLDSRLGELQDRHEQAHRMRDQLIEREVRERLDRVRAKPRVDE